MAWPAAWNQVAGRTAGRAKRMLASAMIPSENTKKPIVIAIEDRKPSVEGGESHHIQVF